MEPIKRRVAFICLSCFLFLTFLSFPAWSGVGTNPGTGNALDYSGSGDWVGSNDADQLTNNAKATVNGSIIGNQNTLANGYIGGKNTINNYGTVTGRVSGSFNESKDAEGGSNIINNYLGGIIEDSITGSHNKGIDSKGGSNIITNNGILKKSIYGSYNLGQRSVGGYNTIINTGNVTGGSLYGSVNFADKSSGGHNNIINSGSVSYYVIGSDNIFKNSTGGYNNFINKSSGKAGIVWGSRNYEENNVGGYNTINNQGTIEICIYGSFNVGRNSIGGDNTITNSGQINYQLIGSMNFVDKSFGGNNNITNLGNVGQLLSGSVNMGLGSIGGNNTIINRGTVGRYIIGTCNELGWVSNDENYVSGGFNTIRNYGVVTGDIYGTASGGDYSRGGNNVIINTGKVKTKESLGKIYGSYNIGLSTSGGSNRITNTGLVEKDIYGSLNEGKNSTGGENTIINSGKVQGSIYGTYNHGENAKGGGNYIKNTGLVQGNIYGTYNQGKGSDSAGDGNIIVNDGTVWGNIYAGDADDTVRILANSQVNGIVDGQTGTDSLYLGTSGLLDYTSFSAKYLNFKNLGLDIYGDTVLKGDWNTNLGVTVRNNGSLFIVDSLSTTDFVNSGFTEISGELIAETFDNAGFMNLKGTVKAPNAHNSGRLILNGRLFGDLVNNGKLSGTGRVFGDLLNSKGVISPGNSIGTFNISGTYTHNPLATYVCELSYWDNSNDLIKANRVVLNGGNIEVILGKAFYPENKTWRIIKAGNSLSGVFDSLILSKDFQQSQILSFDLDYKEKSVDVTLKRASYASFGLTDNQRVIGKTLDSIVPVAFENKDAMAELLYSADWDYSARNITQLLSALNPEMYDAFSFTALNNSQRFDSVIAQRNHEKRLSKSLKTKTPKVSGPVKVAGDETQGRKNTENINKSWNMWAKALGDWAKQDHSAQEEQYKVDTGGVVLGADGPVLPWLNMVFVFGSFNSDLKWDQNYHDGDQKSVCLGLSLSTEKNGFYADALFSYGSYDSNATRAVEFSNFYKKAQADFKGETWSTRLTGGYDHKLGSWVLGPELSLGYVRLNQDSFSEKGLDYLSLNIDERKADYFNSELGFKAGAKYDFAQTSLLPRVALSWRHGFNDDPREVKASFKNYASQSFAVKGVEPICDALDFELGVSAVISKNLNLFVDYALLMGDDLTDQSISAGVNWLF